MKKTGLIFFLSMLLTQSWSQSITAVEIKNKFEQWSQQNPQFKPYLIFNQDKYTSGDTIYFKAYLLTDDLKSVEGKQLLQFSVVNKNSKEVARINFRVQNGVGNNQLILPDTLSDGIYNCTVFNDWMKGYDPSHFFQKEITIAVRKTVQPQSMITPHFSFAFEGGHFIASVSNKLIIQSNRYLTPSTAELVNEAGDVLTSFTINSAGYATVVFTPKPGESYYVISANEKFKLPEAEDDGVTLFITPNANRDPVRFLLSAPTGSVYRKQQLSALLTMNGRVYHAMTIELEEKEFVQYMIPQRDLPEGIAVFTILDDQGIERARRPVYIDDVHRANATLNVIKSKFKTREKIDIELTLNDELGNPLQGECTVTAINQKLFQTNDNPVLNIQPAITDAGMFFSMDKNISNWYSYADQSLLAGNKKRYDWRNILASRPNEYEMSNLIHLKGKIFDATTQEPAADSTFLILYLQKQLMGYETYTKSGEFDIYFLFDFESIDDVFYLASYKGKELRNIKIEWEETKTLPAASAALLNENTDAYGKYALHKRAINKSYSFYSSSPSAAVSSINMNEDFEDEFMGADVKVTLADFIVFPNMDELIREIIPSLTHRVQNGKSLVRIFLSDARVVATDNPLYIIDGVMTKSTEYFMNLQPSEIISIKIVKDINKLNRMGFLGKNGIVLVQTKKPNSAKVKASSTIIPALGLSKPLPFKAPDYTSSGKSSVPDFRSTLYWNPSVKTTANGKASISFSASDDTGPVLIKVQGITANGLPFSASTTIEVGFDSIVYKK